MVRYIICGHGHFGTGLKSSIETIIGKQSFLLGIDFAGDSTKEFVSQLEAAIVDEECIIICDLLGGTPFKESVMLAINNPKVEVITGVNLAVILETFLQNDQLTLNMQVEKMIHDTPEYIKWYQKESIIEVSIEEIDGIVKGETKNEKT